MYNAGDYDTTETVHIPVNSFSSDDPTASVTITNLAAGDVEIHKDGSTTQRSSDSGVSVTIDFDSVTGNHIVSIDLSDNTDAGFYSAGSRYLVRIEGTTVDGGTINAWVGGFSIGCTLRPTTAGRTLDVESGGCAGVDWGNVANKTTANDLSATDIQLVDTCTTNTDMVTEPPTAAAIVNEWETQSQADPTGFHVNVLEVGGTAQTARDLGADTEAIVTDTAELQEDWTEGGRLDLILENVCGKVNGELEATISQDAIDEIASGTAAQVSAITTEDLEALIRKQFIIWG